ncbi:MAG: LytTR family DNA-binding domain-containing protein [Bacteroidia bacterium]|nr:LytTR family DNA-binding domain-containing protein [Bacteroidia bacterium]
MAKKIKAVIIDDMPLAIASLQKDIEDTALDIEVVGTAEGVISGAKLLKSVEPDLIFLDIHMGDGDGFDLLDIIDNKQYKVIFTTASRDHAIKAFQFSAIDYLLKPIDPELLKKAIEKMKGEAEEAPESYSGSITLNTQEEIRLARIDQIIRLEAMGNYTNFHFVNEPKLLVTKTLKEFERILPDHFLRVHQSHLVNRNHIKAYIKTEGGYLLMNDGSHVAVAVRKKPGLIELLSK